jgi:hypothetical protein
MFMFLLMFLLMILLITGTLPFGVNKDFKPVDNIAKIATDIEKSEVPDVQQRIRELKRRSSGTPHSKLYAVTDAFSEVITKALQKDKTRRWFDVSEMLDALNQSLVPASDHFFHVFLSYRVASERELARALHDALSSQQVGTDGIRLKVYLDQVQLVDGQRWDEGFMDGLTRSLIFVPLVSASACEKMGQMTKNEPEGADNVLLEWETALFLKENPGSGLQAVLPIFVGKDFDSDFWKDESTKDLMVLPNIVHKPTRETMQRHLKRIGFEANEKMMKVKQVVDTIMMHQSRISLSKDSLDDTAVQHICECVTNELAKSMMRRAKANNPPPKPSDESPRSGSSNTAQATLQGRTSAVRRTTLKAVVESIDVVASAAVNAHIDAVRTKCVELVARRERREAFEQLWEGLTKVLFSKELSNTCRVEGCVAATECGIVALCLAVMETSKDPQELLKMMKLIQKLTKDNIDIVVPILLSGQFIDVGYNSLKARSLKAPSLKALSQARHTTDDGAACDNTSESDTMFLAILSQIAHTPAGARRIGLQTSYVKLLLRFFATGHVKAIATVLRGLRDEQCSMVMKEMGIEQLVMPQLLSAKTPSCDADYRVLTDLFAIRKYLR